MEMQENEKVTLRDRFRAFRNPRQQSEVPGEARSEPSDLLKGRLASMGGLSDSGVNVTEETSLAFSAVWQARRILSELPASLSVQFFKTEGKNREEIDHAMKDLLANPNQYMNGFTHTELMNDWLQGWGNGVSVIERSGGFTPKQLFPVHPSAVRATIYNSTLLYVVNDQTLGISGTFFPEEVIHYRGFTLNGLWGKSPIMMAKDNIGLGLAAERFGAKFFKKGGNLKAVIEMTGHMSDKEFLEWKSRWEKFYSGEAGDHETPVLEYGTTYKQLGISPEAAQFLQTRQFSIQDVARWFNLPPHIIGDLSRSTFSNIEHQDLQFVKYTLRPILKRQETELENKLLTPAERKNTIIRYNLDNMTRGDLASITTHIKEMYLSGVINKDESRALINRNSVPGGEEFINPANITGKNNNQNNGN
jgi:HK97 family phage portal protein